MLCKMDASNLANMIRRTPNLKITLSQPKNPQGNGNKAETSLQHPIHDSKNGNSINFSV